MKDLNESEIELEDLSSSSNSPFKNLTLEHSPINNITQSFFSSLDILSEEPIEFTTEIDFINACLDENDINRIEAMLRQRQGHLYDNDLAGKYSKMKVGRIAIRRMPAIIITIIFELFVGLVFAQYSATIQKNILLTSFTPVLSALSGNLGLQASTTTLRALSTGHASNENLSDILKVIRKEFYVAFIIGIISSLSLFIVSLSWSRSFRFGLTTSLSVLLNCSMGGLIGSLAPLIFKKIGIDPALMAGPFETALQDMIGTTIYLSLATFILQ